MKNNQNIKKLVIKTLNKYNISNITEAGIKTMISGEGYSVIRFSSLGTSDQTERLLKTLYIENRTEYLDSFTYNDREHRIVFIRKDVSDDEFVYLLALELGRIVTYKTESDGVIGISAEEDRMAQEFAYHLCDLGRHGIVYNFFKQFTVSSVVVAVALTMCISLVVSFFVLSNFFKDKMREDILLEYKTSDIAPYNQNPSFDNTPTVKTPDNTSNDIPVSAVVTENNDKIIETVTDTQNNIDSNSAQAYTQLTTAEYYATKSGKKYHTKDCSYIAGRDVHLVSPSSIQSGELTACSKCIK